MLAGGHAENALPQSATATVNCRIFPGVDAAEVQRTLAQLVADTSITVKLVFPATPSPPSALRPDLFGALEKLSTEFWPGSAVVPGMSNGATDGLYVRNAGVPVYGVAAIFMNPDDDRSHGLDEKVPVESLYRAREFWNRLVRDLTTASTRTM
jgi:acetylornithine deacetylase/succinyl-diaminopimelate desuccinylase-like protein